MPRTRIGIVVLLLFAASPGRAHDIPNARVERSIQVDLGPGRLEIAYEVSLSELTLTQDLRALAGTLPAGDRAAWFERYGEVVGPLNAKGLLVEVDGESIPLQVLGVDLTVEEHPRFTFRFAAPVPPSGHLSIRDTNYVASEGTSRLALRPLVGVTTSEIGGPEDVREIPIRPIWQLSSDEERRTREIDLDYRAEAETKAPAAAVVATSPATTPLAPSSQPIGPGTDRLSRLLDRASTAPLLGLLAIALGLGAAHAIQPGHGKTLVAAAAVGDRGGWAGASALALLVTIAHMAGVVAVAIALWATRSTRYDAINRGLAHGAGFVIAAIGLWRLGRRAAGLGDHDGDHFADAPGRGFRDLLGLGLAGGMVPCWDAVVLVVLAEAIGRLTLGLALLAAFSLGMAGVLVVVGVVAARVRTAATRFDPEGLWGHRLGWLGAAALTGIGLSLLGV